MFSLPFLKNIIRRVISDDKILRKRAGYFCAIGKVLNLNYDIIFMVIGERAKRVGRPCGGRGKGKVKQNEKQGTNIYVPYFDRYAWLNGKITVVPSPIGKPALIQGSYFVPCNANANAKTTVLEVQEGATLNFNCRLLKSSNNIRKTGAGALNIVKPLWTTGTFDVQEGVVNFVDNGVHFEPAMNLAVADGAVLRLGTNTVYDVVAKTNTSVVLDVPDGVSACIGGAVGSVENLYQTLVKTGAGSLAFAATNDAGSGIRVEAGALRFPEKWPSQAAIWLDAPDIGTMTTNAEGHVSSVANKGYAGGNFVPYEEETTAHPTVEAINGLPAFRFDGNDVLRLTSFTNTPPREMVIMIVKERDAFNASCGPFSFGVATATGNDGDSGTGIVSYDKETAKITLDAGSPYRDLTVDGTDGVTVIEVYHVLYNNVFFGQLIASTDPTALTRMDCLYGYFSAADLNTPINLWQIGGRLAAGGVPCLMWNGRIGEVIVFPQPLSTAQATATIDYLRQKWMNVGNGFTNAPLFVTGYSPQANGKLDLALADGTALAHGGATLALNSLSVTGAVDWVRTGPTSSALFTIADELAFQDKVDHYTMNNVFGKLVMNWKSVDMTKCRHPAPDFRFAEVPVEIAPLTFPRFARGAAEVALVDREHVRQGGEAASMGDFREGEVGLANEVVDGGKPSPLNLLLERNARGVHMSLERPCRDREPIGYFSDAKSLGGAVANDPQRAGHDRVAVVRKVCRFAFDDFEGAEERHASGNVFPLEEPMEHLCGDITRTAGVHADRGQPRLRGFAGDRVVVDSQDRKRIRNGNARQKRSLEDVSSAKVVRRE